MREDGGETEISVRANVVVNATGPWTDAFRAMDEGGTRSAVRATKGVHIAVPRERLATHGALTLLSPVDGRVMFALPSTATTIIGTTDTPTDERPEDGARVTRGHRLSARRGELVLSGGAPNACTMSSPRGPGFARSWRPGSRATRRAPHASTGSIAAHRA